MPALCRTLLLVLLASCAATTAAEVADWSQFRGPNRDGKSTEKGLLPVWPKTGPRLAWELKGLGKGYSSVAIADGRLFTCGDRSTATGEEQQLLCYDLAKRTELWAAPIGPTHRDGPRGTPTVDGDRVYVVGTDGDLVCCQVATGKVVWRKHFVRDFGGRMMSVWKFSESPLIDGERVVCTPGGSEAMLAALDKATGEVIWKAAVPSLGDKGADGAGYSSMVAAEIGGTRQYVQLVGRGVVGIAAENGKFLWGYNRVANKVANITTPVVQGKHVFVTTSYKTGSALLEITGSGERFNAREVYWLDFTTFANHHGGVVLAGNYLYGGDGQNNGAPVCLEFLTGKVMWKQSPLGRRSAAIVFADNHLYFRYENGLVALLEASPRAMKVKGTFEAPSVSGPAWPHPVVHDGKLYLRDNDVLMCYDVGRRR